MDKGEIMTVHERLLGHLISVNYHKGNKDEVSKLIFDAATQIDLYKNILKKIADAHDTYMGEFMIQLIREDQI